MPEDLATKAQRPTDLLTDALAYASPNVLRMALYQATRDPELASMRTEVEFFWGNAFSIITLAPEHHDAVKAKALAFLQEANPNPAEPPNETELRQMMDMFAGAPVNDITYEAAGGALKGDEFPLGVQWNDEPPAAVKQNFKVIIIGAGFGGMAAAIQLDQLGIPYEIIERNGGVGGTWWVNRYPEVRVDIPSNHYQYSFMHNYPWKHWFATGDELARYADTVAEKYNLKRNIRFNTELTGARWDEASASWQIKVRGPDGAETPLCANALISAAGLFNMPNLPDIAGIDSFKGKMFHTTQWDHSYDYAGKRVALIGVGSTGAQLTPAIARAAKHLTIYQRSPQWISSFPGYRDPIPEQVQWLFDNIPHYRAWYDFSTFFTIMGGDPGGVQDMDRAWQASGGLISKRSDSTRESWLEYMRSKIGHRPDLMAKLIPDFPPFAKRPVVDNGWFEALDRDNVDLVTEAISRITPEGILTSDGKEREFDFIILGAGFKAEKYLWPVQYYGRGGRTLEEVWDKDGARAYLGMSVSGFPNLFVLYGPNAQARGGGIITWLELWGRYAVQSIVKLIETGKTTLDVKEAVQDDYNSRMDAVMEDFIWPLAKSYYVNAQGRQVVNMPWKHNDYYAWIHEPDFDKYDVT